MASTASLNKEGKLGLRGKTQGQKVCPSLLKLNSCVRMVTIEDECINISILPSGNYTLVCERHGK